MTLINPFVPFIDPDPIEYRREPLGEKGGIFFYNTDEEHVARYLRCGGAIYPEVPISNIAEATLKRSEDNSAPSSSSFLTTIAAKRGGKNAAVSHSTFTPALNKPLKAILNYLPSLSYFTYQTETAYHIKKAPGNFFFRLGKESPFFNNFIASKFAAQAIAFHPYFPIVAVAEQRSPLETCIIRFYDVATSSFIENLILTHPRMRGVTTIVWKPHAKDVLAVGVFGGVMVWSIQGLVSAMAKQGDDGGAGRGRSSAIDAMHSSNNNNNKHNGSSYAYSYSSQYDPCAADSSSFVGGGTDTANNNRNTSNTSTLLSSSAIGRGYSFASGGFPVDGKKKTTVAGAAADVSFASNFGEENTNEAVPRKRRVNELSHILGTAGNNNRTGGISIAEASVDWSLHKHSSGKENNSNHNSLVDNNSNTKINAAATANASMVILGAAAPAFFLTYGFDDDCCSSSSSFFGIPIGVSAIKSAIASALVAPFSSFSFSSSAQQNDADNITILETEHNNNNKRLTRGPRAPRSKHTVNPANSNTTIPVTCIAFSEVSAQLMAISSRGSPETIIHNIACRPRESTILKIANYASGVSSNVSFLQFSVDDKLLIRGYETANRLSVTNISTMATRHFVTPAPILKMCRLECVGFNVFALMLKDTEAVTIAHISETGLTILANIVTGCHGVGAGGMVGGAVLDICSSSFNLYARVSSGHILVIAVSGESNVLLNKKLKSDASSHGGGEGSGGPSTTTSATGEKNNNNNNTNTKSNTSFVSALLSATSEASASDDLLRLTGADSLLAPASPLQTSTTTANASATSSDLEMRFGAEIGAQISGVIPVPAGNAHIVAMDTFPSFVNGALLAVADSERGTLKFVPSYFTRGVASD